MHENPITVLVVEDEVLIRIATVDELELTGFHVLEASSADQAIAIIERHPEVQLIFTDLDMPGMMDGLKLATFVRDRCPPIMIESSSSKHRVDKFEDAGGNDRLVRPPWARRL